MLKPCTQRAGRFGGMGEHGQRADMVG